MSDELAPCPHISLTDEQRLAWLRLSRSENVGSHTFRDLINHFGTAQNALDALPDFARRSGSGRPIRISSKSDAEREINSVAKMGAKIVCMGEAHYPKALLTAENAPPVITVKGDTACLAKSFVAIVGSRNASLSGIKFTKRLAGEVGKSGYSIVSGLARGIDSAAHEASLDHQTVAVFAGGINHIYPRENEHLADEILARGGAHVTEMPIDSAPRAQDFPRRNRIVAGMALGLIVVEAAKRSGSLISARLANEMGRLVFAVPGSPLDPRSEGTNHLIRQGAILITSAEDVVQEIEPLTDELGQSGYSLLETGRYEAESEPSDTDRRKLLDALDRTPTSVDELVRYKTSA